MTCEYILCDRKENLINEWKKYFTGYDNVYVQKDGFFQTKCAAVVSPANSLGMMRGGLDYYLSIFFDRNTPSLCQELGVDISVVLSHPQLAEKFRPRLKWTIERKVKQKITAEYGSMLPVGEVVLVKTGHPQIPFLISAPTMERPERIFHPEVIYNCMNAIIQLAEREKLPNVLVPGLGTGVGALEPKECAQQMEKAFASRYKK